MEPDYRDYTLTMAKVLAGQGHWEKAAAIYRHLRRQEPLREGLALLLQEAEIRAEAGRLTQAEDLVALFQQWFELAHAVERLARLRRLIPSR